MLIISKRRQNVYKVIIIFCIDCINKWFKDNVKCPNCNQDLRDLLKDDDNDIPKNNEKYVDINTRNVNHNEQEDLYADMPHLEDINGNIVNP